MTTAFLLRTGHQLVGRRLNSWVTGDGFWANRKRWFELFMSGSMGQIHLQSIFIGVIEKGLTGSVGQ